MPALLVLGVFYRLKVRNGIILLLVEYKHQWEQAKIEEGSDIILNVYAPRACVRGDADYPESSHTIRSQWQCFYRLLRFDIGT